MARIIAEFTIIPLGIPSTSASKYVAKAVSVIKSKNLRFQVTPTATVIEGEDLGEILNAIREAHEAIINMGIKRIILHIMVDDRLDKPGRKGKDKVNAVMSQL